MASALVVLHHNIQDEVICPMSSTQIRSFLVMVKGQALRLGHVLEETAPLGDICFGEADLQ